MKTFIIITAAALAFWISAAEHNSIPSTQKPTGSRPKTRTAQSVAGSEIPPFNSVEAMQLEFHRRFLASPGFGFSRVLRPIFLAPTPALVHNGTLYKVVPPDLIGLEDEPTVYAAREHSFSTLQRTNQNVRELFRMRPMTALETNAVSAIRSGHELVVTSIPSPLAASRASHAEPELLVVGALRASESCAKCHQCQEGRLLGAFTYTLKPIGRPAGAATNSPAVLSRL